MKYMWHIVCTVILGGMLLCFAGHASAQTNAQNINSIDVSKLTPEQKTQLLASVTAMQGTSSTNISETVRTEASKWGELGMNMGRATVAAAKEVGLAANDFIATPLGKITMAIVVYKIVGREILGLVVGGALCLTGLILGVWLWRGNMGTTIEYEYVPYLRGMWQRRVVKSRQITEGVATLKFVAGGGAIVISHVVGLNMIF